MLKTIQIFSVRCVIFTFVIFNGLAVTKASDTTAKAGPGTILAEFWWEINGTAITDLTGNPDYPDQPSECRYLTSMEIPVDQNDNYGTRLCGFVVPPDTGDYTFWIASDDNGELSVSTSEDPKAKQKIASVPEFTGSREWEKFPSQKSKPVHMEKGKKYYIEALQKEGGGGDNLAVGWQLPNGTKEMPIPGNRLESLPAPKTLPMTVSIKVATPPPDSPGFHSITGTFTYKGKEFPFGAGVVLPGSYFASKEPFPLVVSMHNVVGEMGGVNGDPGLVNEGMGLLMVKDIGVDGRHSGEWPPVKFNPRKQAKFIGLLPQCPKDRGFQSMPMSGVIAQLIDWVGKSYRMDADRVYLTGFSYGGSCTWAVAQQFPEKFAAIAPLSARIAPNAEQSPEILKNVGVWCGVGDQDGDFMQACSKMAEIFKKANHPNFHFTPIKGGGHHCYQAVYGNPDFWKWLLEQHRKH